MNEIAPLPRVNVYIDGFNFYRRIVQKTPFKWLDLELMCQTLLRDYEIQSIKYFTANVKATQHNPSQHLRQQIYFRALRTNPKIQIHLGQFVSLPKSYPAYPWQYLENGRPQMHRINLTQEKGSDVNLASHLIFDVLNNDADAYVVLSNDSDQVGPLAMLSQRTDAVLGLILPGANQAKELLALQLPIVRKIRMGVLEISQLPEVMKDDIGEFSKPKEW
jgi:uncharacterized LabA/DUF88 family protein